MNEWHYADEKEQMNDANYDAKNDYKKNACNQDGDDNQYEQYNDDKKTFQKKTNKKIQGENINKSKKHMKNSKTCTKTCTKNKIRKK